MSALAWAAEGWLAVRLRRKRYRRFLDACRVRPDETIIDIGVGYGGALEKFNRTNPIVALDIKPRTLTQPNVTFLQADARALPYDNGAFPVAFSNSVLQYMSGGDRERYASEVRRVADRYFVQAPYKFFPIDPHFLQGVRALPFSQLLPAKIHRRIARRHPGWEDVDMPTFGEMRRLFPDAHIERERFLGLTKSLIAIRS